jgi:hypothetical protein
MILQWILPRNLKKRILRGEKNQEYVKSWGKKKILPHQPNDKIA